MQRWGEASVSLLGRREHIVPSWGVMEKCFPICLHAWGGGGGQCDKHQELSRLRDLQ